MKLLHDFSAESRLQKVWPQHKIILSMLLLGVALVRGSFAGWMLVIAFGMLSAVVQARVPLLRYLCLLAIPSGFLLLGALPIALQLQGWGEGFFIGYTTESILLASRVVARALAAVSCVYFLVLNTTLPQLLQGLKWMRVPTMLLTLMELMYRYIFVLMEELGRMRIAQRARGGRTSIHQVGQLAASLFLRTYMRGDRIYQALLSRGYQGELPLLEAHYKTSRRLLVQVACCAGTVVLLSFWEGA